MIEALDEKVAPGIADLVLAVRELATRVAALEAAATPPAPPAPGG